MTPLSSSEIITGNRLQELADVSWAPPHEVIKWPSVWNPVAHSLQRGARLLQVEKEAIGELKDKRVIFVYSAFFYAFLERVLPHLGHKFILLMHNGDEVVDRRVFEYIEDNRIVHIFAQNCLVEHPKLTCWPIGLPSEDAINDNLMILARLMAEPECKRADKIYCNFGTSTNLFRMAIWDLVSHNPDCVCDVKQKYFFYLDHMSVYKYVLSPPGSGPDCFRTWEALYMGAYPMVERWPMGSPYCGLPVIEIDDISRPRITDKVREFDRFLNGLDWRCPLRFSFWRRLVEEKKFKAFPWLKEKQT